MAARKHVKNVQIRNVPEGVHRKLKARAEATGQSLNAFLLEELTSIAARESIDDVLERILATGHEPAAHERPSFIDLT